MLISYLPPSLISRTPIHIILALPAPSIDSFLRIFMCLFLCASYKAETILGRHSTMEIRSIHLGGLFHAEEEIQMTSTMPNFVGQLQGFIFNGQRYPIKNNLYFSSPATTH